MSNIKTYTAIDFERYHNGSMPAHEMHALEKAALNDPFLADALDGFIHTTSPVADIKMLQEKMLHKTTQQKKGLLMNIRWWQAAAACVLFGGLGWLFYSLNTTEKTPNVAQNTTPTTTQNTTTTTNDIKPIDSPVTKIAEVSTAETKISKTQQTVKEEVTPTIGATDVKPAPAPIATYEADETLAFKEKQATAAVEMQKQVGDKAKTAKKMAAPQYELKGIVTNEQGAPLANATVKSLNSNKATVTDNNGYYQLKTNNAAADIVVNANGYNNATTNVAANQLNNIVLQNNINQALQGKVAGVNVTQNEQKAEEDISITPKNIAIATPLDNFNSYVAAKLQPIVDKEGNTQKGTVTVHFKVDKNGRPYKAVIKKSTCKACNNQAIAFVKEGPSWPAKQPQTVLIVF